jgi:RHH-type proline utilization regulon transcriptional repressor/proline dehydrogenase/delta 1-pyrroline-5-carboxylate dehydrogenase
VFAALAAGCAVVLKPAPQTPRCALALAEACWAAGVPRDVLQLLHCPEEDVGERLVSHPQLGGIILTGSAATARVLHDLAPDTPLFAETSGKNALVVLPDADLDLAAADLVRSAFGHAGQKCSAASLGILVGEAYDSARLHRKLLDAARSLPIGPGYRPGTAMGPLIGPPGTELRRALTTLDAGEHWLLEPQLVDPAIELWSPGIKLGVRAGSWFHRTECFGPVLGLMAARDLDEAVAIQNSTGFGLTGGIHTLDPAAADRWLAAVEVGNAYVNRAITGAIVRRQPFGGWKASVVGPGAKAGGPNYVSQLGTWHDAGRPTVGQAPGPVVAGLLAVQAGLLGHAERAWLEAAARSDAHWLATELEAEHDPSGLFCEANVLRYRPLPEVVVRAGAGTPLVHVLRVAVAALGLGIEPDISLHPDVATTASGLAARTESPEQFATRMAGRPRERLRLLGAPEPGLRALAPQCYLDTRPVVALGRVELRRYVREQSVSRTLHRFGNLVR